MKEHRGGVAFYGLLLSVTAAGIVLALVPLRQKTPSAPAAGRTLPTRSAPARTTRAGSGRGARAHKPNARRREPRAALVTVNAVRGPSWVVVRAPAGRVLYQGMLVQGGSLRERGSALWAEFGAAGNVDVRVDGRLVQLGRGALTGVILTAQGTLAAQRAGAGIVGS